MKKKGGGGGANWMDTYGDMVTLLLCFFVLLYSMSTVSEDKWRAIVQSFNPDSLEEANTVGGFEGPLADESDGFGMLNDPAKAPDEPSVSVEDLESEQDNIMEALEELFKALSSYVQQNNLSDSITVTQGDGYVFISFNDAVFFDGDSAVLRDDGKRVLDVVSDALIAVSSSIDEIRIMGHTAQASPTQPNTIVGDRTLASNRATNALIYLQERVQDYISPARLISVGYGQHRPIDRNDTEAGRVHNRRVEFLITGKDLLNQLGDSIEQYYTTRAGDADMMTSSLTEATGEADSAGAEATGAVDSAGTEPAG